MIKIKNIVIISLLGAIIIPFIAIYGKIIGSSGYQEDTSENSLSLQVYYNGNSKVKDAWQDIAYDFEDESGIEVNLHIGKTINTEMKNDWNNDTPPDFVWINGNGIGDNSLVKYGKFLDLTEWFSSAKVYGEESFVKDVVNENLIYKYSDGKMYEAPILGLVQGLYYDQTYMNDKSYTIPKNYDELMALGIEAADNGDSMMTYPGKYASYLLWALIMPAIAAYNDPIFFNKVCSAEDANIYDDSRFVDVLNRFYSFCHPNEGHRNVLVGSESYSHTQAQSGFLNHQALSITNGMWLESEIIDSLTADESFKMVYTNSPLIKSDQDPTSVMLASNCGIATYGKHQDNALKFLSYLYKEESQQLLAEAYSYFPANKFAETEEYTLTDITKQTYKEVEENSNRVYKVCDWGTVGDIFNDCINCMCDGSNTVAEAIQRIKDEAKKQ